jgi:exonuclease VII large subunit
MLYIFVFFLGVIWGVGSLYLVFHRYHKFLKARKRRLDNEDRHLRITAAELRNKEQSFTQRHEAFEKDRTTFDSRVVTYRELEGENTVLKRDLQNIDLSIRKLELDRRQQDQRQNELDRCGRELASRYLKENIKWISTSVTPNNFSASKQRLVDVVGRCRSIGFDVSSEEESQLVADLKAEFERVVRAAFEREEQARIKAQIREEQRLEREIEQELKRLERERAAIKAALEKALAETKDKHSEEIERLRSRLAEVEENAKRAISQAQMTKSGHVYVISNIGSFGKGVYKIGMTRRLEPNERVRELSGASVPFPFDVHMMISSDNAPAMENALHHAMHKARLNRVNPRKEFFRGDIESIRQVVEEHHGQVDYVADPEALEYRQSISMSDEDSEYIESVYNTVDDEQETATED